MLDYSVVRRSGQLWKLGVAALLMGAAFGCALKLLGCGTCINMLWWPFAMFGAIVLGLGGAFAWLCLSLRCPRCGAHWLWREADTRDADLRSYGLLSLRRCPRCWFVGQ